MHCYDAELFRKKLRLHPAPAALDELHELIMHELNDLTTVEQIRPEVLALYRGLLADFKARGALVLTAAARREDQSTARERDVMAFSPARTL